MARRRLSRGRLGDRDRVEAALCEQLPGGVGEELPRLLLLALAHPGCVPPPRSFIATQLPQPSDVAPGRSPSVGRGSVVDEPLAELGDALLVVGVDGEPRLFAFVSFGVRSGQLAGVRRGSEPDGSARSLLGDARRWKKRTIGQTYLQAGTASLVRAAVPGVHAAPGFVALTVTPLASSCLASANVQIRFSCLAWA